MKEHIYTRIAGWFNFPEIYKRMVEEFDNAHFVEVGTCFGKSASYMGVEIYNSGKDIKFDTIDTFLGSPNELEGKQNFFLHRDVEKEARNHLKDLPVNVIKGTSVNVSKQYRKELHFVFIDGSHLYDDVVADIRAWKKKIKKGGYIGGHDYDNLNVKHAVRDVLKKDCPYGINSWLLKL